MRLSVSVYVRISVRTKIKNYWSEINVTWPDYVIWWILEVTDFGDISPWPLTLRKLNFL